ncbi:hypothetical protein ACH41H_24290 [Streptomyces sp. NPDC020800]|uniref:hypothetical protein n=1 Tax=Streptomyces sp. NPDC020800 TaxID=3365092 RepID=UPI0037AE0910
MPDVYECYACGAIGRPATDDTVITVLTGSGAEIVILGHTRCTGSLVLTKAEFDTITARRTHSDGADIPSQGGVMTDGRLHERPEAQPMPDAEVKDCPAGGLHEVPDGLGTGQPLADRLVAAHYAKCQPCALVTMASIDTNRNVPALLALVVNWAANVSKFTGSRKGLTGQDALEAWRSAILLDAPRHASEAAAQITYVAGNIGEAHFEAGRLDSYLQSLTRRQRRSVAEYALDGLLGILSLLGH